MPPPATPPGSTPGGTPEQRSDLAAGDRDTRGGASRGTGCDVADANGGLDLVDIPQRQRSDVGYQLHRVTGAGVGRNDPRLPERVSG